MAELGDDRREAQVVGAEVMAPLADAVRLVDDEQRQRAAAEGGPEGRRGEALGRREDDRGPAVADRLERRAVALAVAA